MPNFLGALKAKLAAAVGIAAGGKARRKAIGTSAGSPSSNYPSPGFKGGTVAALRSNRHLSQNPGSLR